MTWILGSTEAAPELAGRGKVPLPAFNRVVELFAGSADTLQVISSVLYSVYWRYFLLSIFQTQVEYFNFRCVIHLDHLLQYETLTREIASLGLQPFHSPLVAILLLLAQSESTRLQGWLKMRTIGCVITRLG